jgi:hypothetical protein
VIPGGSNPNGILASGANVYVENLNDGTISTIPVGNTTVSATVSAGSALAGMASVGSTLYLSRFTDNELSSLNLTNGTMNTANSLVNTTSTAPATSTTTYTGGSSGGGIVISTATTTTSVSSPASSSVTATPSSSLSQDQSLLFSLESELQTLEGEAGGGGSVATTVAPSSFLFTRNLQFGMTGNDVKQLQLFLIAQNIGPAAQRLKINGVTHYFGSLTRAALIELQKKEGITPTIGYFGAKTRGWVNAQG